MSSILLVSPASPVPDFLSLLNHDLSTAASAEEALRRIDAVDVVLVDGRSDLPWARTATRIIRQTRPGIPMLLLAPGPSLGLLSRDWGFSDFVSDGCEAAEVEARLRLLLNSGDLPHILSAGPIRIDEDAYYATISGEPLDLTYTEFELLRYLVQHQGKVLSREVLLSKVWGYDYFGGTRTIDVHIRRLRAKLGQLDHFIGTVRNVGYRFAARWEDHDA